MAGIKLLLNSTKNVVVAANRRIYEAIPVVQTPIYENNYRARMLFAIGKTFVPASLPSALVRFSLTNPAFKLVSSGGTLINKYSFKFTDYLDNDLPFDIAQHDETTGYIAGSFIKSISNAANNLGYIYFNNPDVILSQENRASHYSGAIACWHLPTHTNVKPDVATSDFNAAFSATTGLRGAAANFADTAADYRTVRSSLLTGQTVIFVETMIYLNNTGDVQQILTVPSSANGTDFNIRTHSKGETTPINGLKLRLVGTTGSADYFYRDINLVANTWYHIAAIFNTSGVLQLYLNGVFQSASENTSAEAGPPGYTDVNLYVGGVPGDTNYMNGRIDDILITGGAPNANSIAWRARNCLYPDSSFVVAELETPGQSSDIIEGLYFDILNSETYDINISNLVYSAAGRTGTIDSFTPPASGEGSVTQSSSTQLVYTPASSFVGTPEFTITVSTA